MFCLLSVPFWCLGSSAFAQDSTATSSSVTTKQSGKKEPKTSTNPKARNTNQSLAQGLSVAEAAMLNDSPLAFSLSTSAGRGVDEFADSWSSSTAFDISYTLNRKSALSLSLGYDTILISHDGDLFNSKAQDPRQYGLSDVELTYSLPNVWSDKYNRLVINTSVSFPSSTTSQRAGMIADASVVTALRYRPFSKLIITPQVGMYARAYRYDTADAMGFLPNSPLGVLYGLSGSYIFMPWLTGSMSYNQTWRYDYFSDWRAVQSISVQASALVADTMTAFVGYRWRDRMITNDSMFDDDRSLIFTGVSYAF